MVITVHPIQAGRAHEVGRLDGRHWHQHIPCLLHQLLLLAPLTELLPELVADCQRRPDIRKELPAVFEAVLSRGGRALQLQAQPRLQRRVLLEHIQRHVEAGVVRCADLGAEGPQGLTDQALLFWRPVQLGDHILQEPLLYQEVGRGGVAAWGEPHSPHCRLREGKVFFSQTHA